MSDDPIDLDEKRKKAKEKRLNEQDQLKLKPARVYQILADVINDDPLCKLPSFGRRFTAYSPSPGVKILLEITGDFVASKVPEEVLISELLRYTRNQLGEFNCFQLTHKQALEAVKLWLSTVPAVPEPKAYGWPGDTELAFQRLPWTTSEGATPTWDSLLANLSNARAFRQWLGSLFFEESYLQAYVWIRGVGNDGKGSINRFLKQIFGHSYCSKQPPAPGDKFWSYGLLNKRIVVFPDCNSRGFVASGLFKTLTGADPIDIEAKGQMSFTVELKAKYLVLSNERPTISSERADKRRIIYCEFKDRNSDKIDPGFELKLWEEGGHFLGACMREYEEACPAHEPIMAESHEINEWIETVESDLEEVMDTYFEVDFTVKRRWVTVVQYQRIIQKAFKEKTRQRDFLEWLERIHKIRRQTVRIDDNILKSFKGLCLKQVWRELSSV